MTWYGRLTMWIFVVVVVPLVMMISSLLFVVVANAAPAQIITKGDASSKRQECNGRRDFAKKILKMRDRGDSIEIVYGTMMARAAALGMPASTPCEVKPAIDLLWGMHGTAKEVGDSIFYSCMKGDAM